MVVSVALCKYCFCALSKFIKYKPSIDILYSSKILCSSYTDGFLSNLVLEEGIKQESNLTKYFENISSQNLVKETLTKISSRNKKTCDLHQQHDVQELVCCIEEEIDTKIVPNEKLKYLLVYFTKDGNVNGVKAVQTIIKKYNIVHFKYQAEYNHYLAEAFWISGKMHMSINLFSVAYDSIVVRPKVKIMLPNLFPLLTSQHSDAALCKVIYDIENFSAQKRDDLILACLWRELFLSTWFSDQKQASQLLLKNNRLLKIVQWMIPKMGRTLLRSHRIEDFYRLIKFSLENEFKPMTDSLIRLLFEYYYIHQNIERCTAIVKYSSNLNSPLTEEQHRRYVGLLLKSKDAIYSKSIIKKPQNLKYEF